MSETITEGNTTTEENITTIDHASATENASGQEDTSASSSTTIQKDTSASKSSTIQEDTSASGSTTARKNASVINNTTAPGTESAYNLDSEMDPFDKAEKERERHPDQSHIAGHCRRVCLEPAGPAHAHHGRQDPLQHCQPDKPAGAAGHRGRVQGPQGAGLPAPHGRGNCRQVDGPAGAVPAGGGASGLYGRKTGGPAGDAGQHCHAKLLCYGKADGPRGRAYRQCVRHHHPVQRIQPDFLAVFAAEHGLHRLNET